MVNATADQTREQAVTTHPGVNVDWLRTARIFALEEWWPPFWPHIEVDWDKALWTMQRLNLDTLQANALTKVAFYPTDLIKTHAELGDRDILQESSDFCRKHGFRMIMYTLFGHAMPISTVLSMKHGAPIFEPMVKWDGSLASRHDVNVPAEFRDYRTVWHFGWEPYIAHCVFAMEPWLLEHVGELADRYEYQGAWVDASTTAGADFTNNWRLNVCCCEHCQDMYKEDFGEPMPAVSDLRDPQIIPVRRWVQRRLDGVMERMRRRLTKGFTMPLIGNMSRGGGEAVFHDTYMRHLQGGLFENGRDTVDMARRLSQSRQTVEVPIHYPDRCDALPRRVTTGWEVENKGLMILSFDCLPYLALPNKYYYDDSTDEPARRIFDFMAAHEALIDKQRPDAYASVVSPPYYCDAPQHERLARGWTSLMLDTHILPGQIPYHRIKDINTARPCQVLLVPDVQVISDEGIAAILCFAEEGGGVLISGQIGVRDEEMRPRPAERLAEMLDLHPWDGDLEAQQRRAVYDGEYKYGCYAPTYELYSRVEDPGMGLPLPDPFHINPCELGDVEPGESWKVCAWAVGTDRNTPLEMPTLAVRQFGKGRLVYAGSPFEGQYLERRCPVLGSWLRDLILWLGGKPHPVEVEASHRLQMGSTRLQDGGRLVYLINQSNDIQTFLQGGGAMLTVCDRPLPIGEVSVRVAATEIDAIYGPAPDHVEVRDSHATAVWKSFTDHVVLHAKA